MRTNLPYAITALFLFRILPIIAAAAIIYFVTTDVWQWVARS